MSIALAHQYRKKWLLYAIVVLILISAACWAPIVANANGPEVTAQKAQRAALAMNITLLEP